MMRRTPDNQVETTQSLDPPLLSGLVILAVLSLAVLYSAGEGNTELLVKQSIRIGFAFVVMLAVSRVSPLVLARWSPYVYAAGLAFLLLVPFFGIVGKGAQRWLSLGFFQFQPSEIMKIAVPMMVAWIFSRGTLPPKLWHLLLAALAVLAPTFLVVVQPDLGTAILICLSGLTVIFFAGISWKFICGVGVALGAAAPLMWLFGLHEYQQRRILTLFDPWADPLGAGYHMVQSMIAIGSGGLTGKGWLSGTQSQLKFIPERSTDFIFAVYAEEFGMLGVLLLMALYLLVVARGLFIALNAHGTFERLLGGALAVTFFFYVFVNIGMVSGILPVVGVPLPLISYGGTSMVTLLLAFGILFGIQRHKRTLSR